MMNNMMFILSKSLPLLFLPPLNCLLLATLGGLIMLRRKTAGKALVIAAFVALYLLSTPWIGSALRGHLEGRFGPAQLLDHKVQAIVILGGGCVPDAPEYLGDTVGAGTLQRLRWGVRLHKLTGLPILTAGGKVPELSQSEADLMAETLQQDFAVRAHWLEAESLTTFENALRSREILAVEGISRILLVTHAWHMPRAEFAFRRAGFEVVAAPTGFQSPRPLSGLDFIASMDGLRNSTIYFHETLGMLWYRLRLLAGATAA
jgi:uncharacterized SAM-binding protein YcdF (DUF218 family)